MDASAEIDWDKRLASAVLAGGRLRGTLLELWQRTRMDWGFVTDRLSQAFRHEKWIGSNERRFISETLYGMLRNLRRIDTALTSARKGPPRDLERVLVYFALHRLITIEQARLAAPDVNWPVVLDVDRTLASERDAIKRLALSQSLPDWLAQRLVADWGEEATALAAGLNQRAPMTVRANLLAGDRAQLTSALAAERLVVEPGQFCETAAHVTSRTNLFSTDAFTKGAMEAQDEGSQLLAALAVPRHPDGTPRAGTVVDLCAGAGGKTLAIAAAMGNRGRILASDIDGKKLEELRRRARRAGVSVAQAVTIERRDDQAIWPAQLEALRGKADMVLVDAPCSGIGALRRNPEARYRLREEDIAMFAKRQANLLYDALGLCAPGGVVVYATCTVLRQENQDVVERVLARTNEFTHVAASTQLPTLAPSLQRGLDFCSTPHLHNTDGFFAAVLRRQA